MSEEDQEDINEEKSAWTLAYKKRWVIICVDRCDGWGDESVTDTIALSSIVSAPQWGDNSANCSLRPFITYLLPPYTIYTLCTEGVNEILKYLYIIRIWRIIYMKNDDTTINRHFNKVGCLFAKLIIDGQLFSKDSKVLKW